MKVFNVEDFSFYNNIMASSKDYLNYILELLGEVKGITFKKMMGEFILYKNDIIFGGIYDNRFLVKNVVALSEYDLKEEIPYPGGKKMLLIDSENPEEIAEIVNAVYRELKNR